MDGPSLDCLKKIGKCLEWISLCQDGDKHHRSFTKRDASDVIRLDAQNVSREYHTFSTRTRVRTLTLSVSGSAVIGLLLGMLTMSLILWRCKKRDRWNQSVLYRTERSGDLNDARNRDSSAFLQRNHNENELFNRDNDHTSSGHCSSSQSLEGYTCLTVRLPDKTQNNTCLHPVLKGDKEQKATFDNQVES